MIKNNIKYVKNVKKKGICIKLIMIKNEFIIIDIYINLLESGI